MNLFAFDRMLNELLRMDDYAAVDASWNGVQIACGEKEISRVAVAVDAAAETAARAAEWDADVLLVHHGLFWGAAQRITGTHYRRVRTFLENDMALYAAHLPLDAHDELGNNARMARHLRLENLRPFGAYKGLTIGWAGELPRSMTTEEVARALFGTTDDLLGVLPFGNARNRSVGIVSGGAPRDVAQAIDDGLDLFITGDASHTIYHNCLEAGINVMFGGHYRTETWGVQAVADYLQREVGIEAIFVDVPTGL